VERSGGFLASVPGRSLAYGRARPMPLLQACWISFSIVWNVLVVFSRLYLGVHSLTDVLAALPLGIGLLCVGVFYADAYHDWVVTAPLMLVSMLVLYWTVLLLHPRPYPTTSWYTSATILGMAYGLHAGYLLLHRAGCGEALTGAVSGGWRMLLLVVLVVTAVFSTREVAKFLANWALSAVFLRGLGCSITRGEAALIERQPSFSHGNTLHQLREHRRRSQLHRLHQPQQLQPDTAGLLVHTGHETNLELLFGPKATVNVDIPVKFFTYFSMAIVTLLGSAALSLVML